RIVCKADLLHVCRIINTASIEYDRIFQQLFDAPKIRPAKFIPLGENQQSRRSGERIVISVGVVNSIAKDFPRLFRRLRVKRLDSSACLQKLRDDRDRRRVSYLLTPRLKG